MSPKSHTFTDAELGRGGSALRVTLSSLPRTSMTPHEISIANRDKLFGIKNVSSPVFNPNDRFVYYNFITLN